MAVPCGTFARAEPLTWGGIESHPAVVNPVMGIEDGVSLRGEWEFLRPTRDLPNRNGVWSDYSTGRDWAGARPISVPGTWEAQGVGEPGMSQCWDVTWDHSSKPLRHKYMGEGWYRKFVDIPSAWKGKRIWIKIGGVSAVGWVWVNDRQVAHVASYCATEKFEITQFVEPGEKAKIVIDVDNRKPSRKGDVDEVHKWGGIIRDVELEATPSVFIDDAWARGDFDARAAEIHVSVGGPAKEAEGLRLRAEIEGRTAVSAAVPGDNVLRLPIGKLRVWSPESPNLYTAVVALVSSDGSVLQRRRERFGVRKLEVRGEQLFLNGRPFFVRGFGDVCVYPLSGVSPADREYHRRHLAKARAAGFNFVRLHTHCEMPEYFEAADELGLLIQPELPYYSDVPCEGFEFDPARDVRELWRNFRRHPSFAVYSMGNEGSFGPVLDRRLHELVKAMDPDRLKINQDSNSERMNLPECSDFCGGPIKEWKRGSFNPGRPFVCHEYLNLCIKSDARDEDRFTGVWMPPVTRADRERWLAKYGLDAVWSDRLQDAQHVLQRIWQKHGVESARADPYCDGFSFWTLVDCVVSANGTYTAQGLFNPFWEPKRGGFAPEEFAVFNGETVLLVESEGFAAHIASAGDRVPLDVSVSHFGERDLPRSEVVCTLTADGKTLFEKRIAVEADVLAGPVRKLVETSMTVPRLDRPVRASLSVAFGEARNEWDWWLFPKRERRKAAGLVAEKPFLKTLGRLFDDVGEGDATGGLDGARVAVAKTGSAFERVALASGCNVLSVSDWDGEADVSLGWWWMGSQVGTAIRDDHPALSNMPTRPAMDGLWFRTVRTGAMALPQPRLSSADLLIVAEGGQTCRAYLSEKREGRSVVLRASGLALLAGLPETDALLAGLVERLHALQSAPRKGEELISSNRKEK